MAHDAVTGGRQWCAAAQHDRRHFYAPGLIASGCYVVAVQRALGHAKSTTPSGLHVEAELDRFSIARAPKSRRIRR